MKALPRFTSLTWLSLLVWVAMFGWLNTPRTVSILDFASKDMSTGTYTIQISGYHNGAPPAVLTTSESETGWPRTYLQRTLAFPNLTIQNKWIYANLLQDLTAAVVVVFFLICLTQEIGVPKLRDYFFLLTIAAILIVVGKHMASDREHLFLETTIQLACVVPIPAATFFYLASALRRWQNKTVRGSSRVNPTC